MKSREIKCKINRFIRRLNNMHRQSGKSWISIFVYNLRLKAKRKFCFVEIHDNMLDLLGKEYEDSFLNWEEQKQYLSILNPRKYFIVARNKYLTHAVLDNLGIKGKSKLICYYNPEMGVCRDNTAIDCNSVKEILRQSGLEEFVIKTTESSHGDNVWVIKGLEYLTDDAILIRFDDKKIMLSDVLSKEPLIFETIIRQTAQLASFNATSVNTVRFMTTLLPNGEAKIIATFIKIGRAGKCVDNAGSGGNVDAAIDVQSGMLYNSILFEGWRKITPIDRHPDSNAKLNGTVIENWNTIKEKVIEYQKQLPFIKAAGWDIAITPEGPIIIEVNDMWDRTGQLFRRQGWKAEIKECFDAWKEYYRNNN